MAFFFTNKSRCVTFSTKRWAILWFQFLTSELTLQIVFLALKYLHVSSDSSLFLTNHSKGTKRWPCMKCWLLFFGRFTFVRCNLPQESSNHEDAIQLIICYSVFELRCEIKTKTKANFELSMETSWNVSYLKLPKRHLLEVNRYMAQSEELFRCYASTIFVWRAFALNDSYFNGYAHKHIRIGSIAHTDRLGFFLFNRNKM